MYNKADFLKKTKFSLRLLFLALAVERKLEQIFSFISFMVSHPVPCPKAQIILADHKRPAM